jgi:AcrR family transcriptional regulator
MPEIINGDYQSKMVIQKALAALVESKPFKVISVVDICEKAGISRQTFYNHFEDKYKVCQWFFDLVSSDYLYETGRSLSYHDANLLNNYAVLENLSFFSAVLDGKGYSGLLPYVRRKRRGVLAETIVSYKKLELTEDLAHLLEFHVQGETHLVVKWIHGGAKESPGYIADICDRGISRELWEILKDPTPGCTDPRDLHRVPILV